MTAPENAPALHADQDSEQAQHGDMLFAAPGSTLTHQVPLAYCKLPNNGLHACVLRALWRLLPLAMISRHCQCTEWALLLGSLLGHISAEPISAEPILLSTWQGQITSKLTASSFWRPPGAPQDSSLDLRPLRLTYFILLSYTFKDFTA